MREMRVVAAAVESAEPVAGFGVVVAVNVDEEVECILVVDIQSGDCFEVGDCTESSESVAEVVAVAANVDADVELETRSIVAVLSRERRGQDCQ